MVRLENVSLCLNNRLILKNLSLAISEGQTVLLVGSSGAGKSTILRLILGLLPPTSGEIWVSGQNISRLSDKALNDLRRQFGLVFQNGALFDSLTLEENIGFFLSENSRLPEPEVRRRVLEVTQFFGLDRFLDYYPSEISGGMKKRVAIARAIVTQPRMLLYDEPTAGLDPLAARKVVEMIVSLKQRFNVTSLVVTHEIHHFVTAVDRLLMLKNGQINYDGPSDLSILDHYEETEAQTICNPVEAEYEDF